MIKVILRKVRINKGGYDSNGNYWGIGYPLYYYEYTKPDGFAEFGHMRQSSRDGAKELIAHWIIRDCPDNTAFTFYDGPFVREGF